MIIIYIFLTSKWIKTYINIQTHVRLTNKDMLDSVVSTFTVFRQDNKKVTVRHVMILYFTTLLLKLFYGYFSGVRQRCVFNTRCVYMTLERTNEWPQSDCDGTTGVYVNALV